MVSPNLHGVSTAEIARLGLIFGLRAWNQCKPTLINNNTKLIFLVVKILIQSNLSPNDNTNHPIGQIDEALSLLNAIAAGLFACIQNNSVLIAKAESQVKGSFSL